MREHAKPLPIIDDFSRAYWEAAAERRLLIQRCAVCGIHQFYPRPHCVGCFALHPQWVEARGTGSLHTFSVVHKTVAPGFADELPYVFAIVELDEGVRLTTNIVATPIEELHCDMRVHVVFVRVGDDLVLPMFTRASDVEAV